MVTVFAAVGEGSELDGATADDGGQVGGRTGSGGLRWRWGGGTGCRRGGGADDFAGEPGGHVAGVGGVAAADRVGACGGGGAANAPCPPWLTTSVGSWIGLAATAAERPINSWRLASQVGLPRALPSASSRARWPTELLSPFIHS